MYLLHKSKYDERNESYGNVAFLTCCKSLKFLKMEIVRQKRISLSSLSTGKLLELPVTDRVVRLPSDQARPVEMIAKDSSSDGRRDA